MHDAFISFSFEDQPIAEKIADTLVKKYGISCWICSRNLSGGQHFKEQIPAAIDASSVVVFIQSSRALESREIPKEISLAFDAEKLIIPFRLDDAKPKGNLRYDLAGIEYIDATKPTMDARIAELAASINEYMGRTSPSDESSAPVLRSTPVTCSEIFHGRDDIFDAIDEAYAEGRSTVFLRGMGGIGKSENPNIIIILEHLTICYIKTLNKNSARKYLDIALDIAVKLYTDDHPLLMRLRSLSAEIGA